MQGRRSAHGLPGGCPALRKETPQAPGIPGVKLPCPFNDCRQGTQLYGS